MEAKLVVLAPAEIVNTEFNLQLPVTIGRGRDAKIKLVHGQISRLHCELYEDNGQLKARDLGSLNGTFVDGERVSDETLKPGGLLNIGSVTFRAVYGAMPAETDDSTVDFGAPRITETVSTTSTVMEDAFPNFGEAEAQDAAPFPVTENSDSAADDDLGMFDFAEEEPAAPQAAAPAPASPKPAAPKPAADDATISMPAPAAPAAPAFVPPVEPAKDADVDDWLNIEESEEKKAEDDDLNSFFNNLK